MSIVAVIVVADVVLAGRTLAGRPLLAHTLDQTLAARHVGRIVVVTADETLAHLARSMSADVVASPDDAKGADAALRLALAGLEPDTGFVADTAMLLTPDFPLRSAVMIDAALEHLGRVGADTLVSVHPLEDPLWLRDEGDLARPAEAPPTCKRFVQNGAVVAVNVAAFEREGGLPAGRVVLFDVGPIEALKVRAADDWRVVDALVRGVRARDIVARLRAIRLLAFDFDGVMTDNRVLVFDDGREAVLCNRGDGLGLDQLRAAGLPLVVISKERNPVVAARCAKLSLRCEQGVDDKLTVLRRIAAESATELADVAFFGNDINDLPCLHASGLAIAPADAHAQVLRQADYITSAPGGAGAVREICDLWLAARTES